MYKNGALVWQMKKKKKLNEMNGNDGIQGELMCSVKALSVHKNIHASLKGLWHPSAQHVRTIQVQYECFCNSYVFVCLAFSINTSSCAADSNKQAVWRPKIHEEANY